MLLSKNLIILSFILSLSPFVMSAQDCNFVVEVKLDGEKCDYCIIQVLKLDTFSLLDIKYTNELGYVPLNLESKFKNSLIRVSYFGYKDSLSRIDCSRINLDTMRFNLLPLSVSLEELTILDKIALIKKNADTTTFNLKAIQTGNELSTFDIIKKFPGLDLVGNSFTYHGQKISEIYLDNIDVSDDNQRHFTDNIRYDLISQIQIIENQNINNQLEVDSTQLGLTMRLYLKEEAKRSLQIGLEGALGYLNVYSGSLSSILIKKLNGWRVEALINNSYDKMSNPSSDLILGAILSKTLFTSTTSKTTFENPRRTNIFNGGETNRIEREITLNYSHTIKKNKIKSINKLISEEGEALRTRREDFFLESISFNSNQRNFFHNLNFTSFTKISMLMPDKTSINIDLPMEFSTNQNLTDVNISRGFFNVKNTENIDMCTYNINPNFSIEFKNNNTNFRLLGSYKILKDNSAQRFTTMDSTLYQILINHDSMTFGQTYISEQKNTEQQLRIIHDFKKFKIELNSLLLTQNENLDISKLNLFQNEFEGITKLTRIINDNSIYLKFDQRLIHFQTGIKHFQYFQTVNEETNKDSGINPYFLFMYKLNWKWRISTSFNSVINLPNIYQFSTISLFNGLEQLESGNLPIMTQEDKQIVNLSLFKVFETGENSSQFNLNLNYTLPYISSIQQPEINSILLKTNWQLVKINNNYNLNFIYGINKRMCNFNIRLNSSFQSLDIQNFTYSLLNNSISINFKYQFKRIITQSSLQIRNSKTFQAITINNNFINFATNFTHENQRFSQLFKVIVIGNLIGGNLILRPILSFDLGYVIPSKNVRFSIIGANINNLSQNTITSNSSTQQSINISENALQAGNIMLRIKKIF